MAETIVSTDSSFKADVLDSTTPVVVDFWATWCAPCKALSPALEDLAGQYKGKIRVVKVNVDENQVVAQQFGVMTLPTILTFKGGKVINQLVGGVTRAKIEESIKKAI